MLEILIPTRTVSEEIVQKGVDGIGSRSDGTRKYCQTVRCPFQEDVDPNGVESNALAFLHVEP